MQSEDRWTHHVNTEAKPKVTVCRVGVKTASQRGSELVVSTRAPGIEGWWKVWRLIPGKGLKRSQPASKKSANFPKWGEWSSVSTEFCLNSSNTMFKKTFKGSQRFKGESQRRPNWACLCPEVWALAIHAGPVCSCIPLCDKAPVWLDFCLKNTRWYFYIELCSQPNHFVCVDTALIDHTSELKLSLFLLLMVLLDISILNLSLLPWPCYAQCVKSFGHHNLKPHSWETDKDGTEVRGLAWTLEVQSCRYSDTDTVRL